MLTSVRWINDYLERDCTADEQADLLTRAGFPIEEREDVDAGGVADVRLDVELTSNRGDCLAHLGLAREISAISGIGLTPPAADPRPGDGAAPASGAITVENRDHAACPRYTARLIRGVTVRESPAWLQERLRARGDVPRNNVVDATNFVLFELGQPTHVFDLATLAGPGIVVRRAAKGERLLPLGEDAKEIELHPDDLVIADREKPVALAGVKGGAPSAVSASTTDILVEAATFDPVAVRSASRRHQIASDSAYRFERGVHPAQIDGAADRLVALILELAGGTLHPGTVEDGAPIPGPRTVVMRPERCRRLLGVDVPDAAMVGFLERLGFEPRLEGDAVTCSVPAARLDVEREADLIEEVARLHGLEDGIPVRDRVEVRVEAASPRDAGRRAVAGLLVGEGFLETVTHSLVSEAAAAPYLPDGLAALRVDDERAGAEPVLRPSVLPSLARVAAHNRDQGQRGIRLFERAATFARDGDGHLETVNLGLLHEADASHENPLRATRGLIDRLVQVLLGPDARVTVEPADGLPWLAPGGAVRLDGNVLGTFGLLSPAALAAADLEGAWAACELGLPAFEDRYPPVTEARALPSHPAIERDLSIVVDDAVHWSAITSAVHGVGPAHLEACDYVGTFRDARLGEGRRSTTLRLRFRAADRTLTHEEVDPAVAAVVDALASGLGAELRS